MELTFVGYNHIHDSDFDINRPLGSGDYLALLIKTPAIFTIDGQELRTPPNIFFLYKKNSSQYYRACEEVFINDWFHFDLAPEEADFFENLQIPFEKPVLLKDIDFFSMLVNNLNIEHYSSNMHKKNSIACYFNLFFNKISEEIIGTSGDNYNKNYDKFALLRSKIYSRPYLKWNILNLSHQICLSPSYFQYLYKKYFGITCIADIIHARIQYSKQLLCTTSLSIRHISEQCGYENEVHFMRQFKSFTGLTPSQFRKLNSVPNHSDLHIDRSKPDIY